MLGADVLSVSGSDSRRAVFHIGNNLYSSKLVDLPCIIEAQKTLDSKQMFKVADICQVRALSPRVCARPFRTIQLITVVDAACGRSNTE